MKCSKDNCSKSASVLSSEGPLCQHHFAEVLESLIKKPDQKAQPAVVSAADKFDQELKEFFGGLGMQVKRVKLPTKEVQHAKPEKINAERVVVPNHIKYPQYFKDVRGMQYMDVYAVHKVFALEDSSGALQHASKKILLSGVRTGNKTVMQDIVEARDALDRWIDMNQPVPTPGK